MTDSAVRDDVRELDQKPWHKQFWPWFLISMPLIAVIGGVITFAIAVTYRDGLSCDDCYK